MSVIADEFGASRETDLGPSYNIAPSLPIAVIMVEGQRRLVSMKWGLIPHWADDPKIAQKHGVDALALHPRTARQGFTGQADWSLITRLKAQSDVPVIGNGDIAAAEDAVRMLVETRCDAVMIGRAAIGHPWIFQEIAAVLAGREPVPPTLADRFTVMRQYLRAAVVHKGEAPACRMMRSRLGWFVKGLPHSAGFREALKQIADQAAAEKLIDEYQEFLETRREG
ncbi:MAG: tRNA-dihydrouridine synthase [Desulfosudaceae bacterium]